MTSGAQALAWLTALTHARARPRAPAREKGNSWADTWQECQRCCINVYPYRQTPLEKSNEDSNKIDSSKHHPENLCQRCIELGHYCRKTYKR